MKFFKNFGITKGYPNLRRIRGKLADFFALCRPFTLLGAWMAGFFLDILFSKPNIDFLHSFLVGMVLALLQAGGQACNQSLREEVEIDKINKKLYRPTVSGRMSLNEAKVISAFLFLAGISLAFLMNLNYGLFSVLIAFFAVAYTTPPFRMKKHFFLNNLWQGIARGFLPALYVASAYPEYTRLAVPYGLILLSWVTFFQGSKDITDIKGDQAYNIKTLPVVLGKQGALKFMMIGGIFSYLALICFCLLSILPYRFLALVSLFPLSCIIVYSLKREIKSSLFENSLGWICFYSNLALFYVLPVLLV